MSGFPDILNVSHKQSKQKSQEKKSKEKGQEKKSKTSPSKANYKGITLKQYFRICEEEKHNETLGQIKQQSCGSSNSSLVGTPSFNNDDHNRQYRGKIKTQVCQADHQTRIHQVEDRSRLGHPQSLEKQHKGHYIAVKKRQERKKIYTKVNSQFNKEQNNIRSTLNSFYQVEENKKKMLRKLQQEKQRVNDMRLSDAFFITKYGSRFKIDSKTIKS